MTASVSLAAVAAGAVGAVLRYLVTRAFGATRFPWAVLAVNVAGSTSGGVVLALADTGMLPAEWQLIVLGGLAGGLTTFSTLSVSTVELARSGRWRAALGNVFANLGLGIAAVCAGFAAVHLLL
jgi:CrcB protein